MVLRLLNRYKIRADGKILDIGCGKGAFTARIKQNNPSAYILAVDVAPTAIRKAREKYGHLNIDFEVLDIQRDYKSIPCKFDLIVMQKSCGISCQVSEKW